jgi:DNA-binding MurR/RpiR family transcriptional regulator
VVLLAATGETTIARSLCAKIAHLFLVELLVLGCMDRLGHEAAHAADLTMAAVLDKMF